MLDVRTARALAAGLLVMALTGGCGRPAGAPALDAATRRALAAWLETHGKPPTEYVVGLFDHHDVVFLGENHYIRHDVLFVQSLFEPLYRAGVRTFATEFARREDQGRIDSLLAAPVWDEGLARSIIFNQFVLWGYQEYVDVLRAAWVLNRSLPPDAPRFCVLGVNDSPDWSLIRTRQDADVDSIKAKVWRGGGEKYWAGVILDAVNAGQKVLVHSGSHHALSAFHHPIVIDGRFLRFEDARMGNYVYRAIGPRAVTVFLHAPWPGRQGTGGDMVHAADGVIDEFMRDRPAGPRPVGFDLAGSPFGSLPARTSLYAMGQDDFQLSMFCDGWIYDRPIAEYQGVTPIPDWINADNLDAARARLPNPDWRTYTAGQLNARIARIADLRESWGPLR